jgi:hypothetical protein
MFIKIKFKANEGCGSNSKEKTAYVNSNLITALEQNSMRNKNNIFVNTGCYIVDDEEFLRICKVLGIKKSKLVQG